MMHLYEKRSFFYKRDDAFVRIRRKGARHNAHLLPDFWSEARSEKQKTNEAHWFVQKRTFIFAMPRTIGAKDRAAGARVRNETDEAKAQRAKKSADTRAANQKRKIDEERAATADRVATFFHKRTKKAAEPASDSNNEGSADDERTADEDGNGEQVNDDGSDGSDGSDAEELLADIIGTGEEVDVVVPPGITANYDVADEGPCDIDDEDGGGGGGNNGPDSAAPLGLMKKYIYQVHERLKYELGNKITALEEKWLLIFLKKKENGWWIRKENAEYICKKIPELKYGEQSYYRDIRVWLPDQQYGILCMPFCGACRTNENVGAHGFRDNHYSRTVIGLKENYYLISRRYICHQCKRDADALKKRIEEDAADGDLEVIIDTPKTKTFMGWNATSNSLLPYGKGDEFPAFLTWRAAVDKGLIDLMRPLFDFGVRPEQFSKIILEMHAKQYARQYIKYERKIEENNLLGAKPEMYSDFADKEKYADVVPTGNYFSLVYKRYHKSIRQFLSKEMKKRDSRQLSWDVSYKVNKKMCQYHGQAVSYRSTRTCMRKINHASHII